MRGRAIAREETGAARSGASFTAGVTRLIAVIALMLGGGIGAMVALATSPAGASTAHGSGLPPVNVSVANTPTVNVGNLPTNSAGRLRVQNGIGTNVMHQFGGGVWGNTVTAVCNGCQPNVATIANISGPGLFYGMAWWGAKNNCTPFDGVTNLIIDGNSILNNAWSNYDWPNNTQTNVGNNQFFGGSGSPIGGTTAGCNSPEGHFYPPVPIPFQHSLVVQMYPAPWWNQPGAQVMLGAEGWYSTGNSP